MRNRWQGTPEDTEGSVYSAVAASLTFTIVVLTISVVFCIHWLIGGE